MKKFMAIVGIISVLLFSHWIAFMEGRSDVMRNTVVEFGSPYYRKPYFGRCQTDLMSGDRSGMACAHIPREDEREHP